MFFCLYSRNLRRWKWLGFCYSQTPWLWSNQVMFFPLMVITKSNKGLLCLGYMLESCQPIPQLSTVISGGGTQALFKVPRATLLYSQRRNHCSHVYEMFALGRDSAKQFQHVLRLVSRNLLAILSLWPAGPVSVAPPKLSGLTVSHSLFSRLSGLLSIQTPVPEWRLRPTRPLCLGDAPPHGQGHCCSALRPAPFRSQCKYLLRQ